MQQAIPYKSWQLQPLNTNTHFSSQLSLTLNNNNTSNSPLNNASTSPEKFVKEAENMRSLVSENAVIVFGRRGCCMSHVVKRLLLGLGVNPAVYEVDEKDDVRVVEELELIGNGKDRGKVQFPAVFIGGSLFGGLDRLMATHISGELVPILKQAGALWL
ncbi:glutaredoxin-C9-like [Corylus avellana]|uniref:glutaredoxin-C9-like n=1 Tax=Corylus avellana TaxID=13451 RepID=UPI001E20F589|nr:glutaredoxin-C9-like [Corylus avellana]